MKEYKKLNALASEGYVPVSEAKGGFSNTSPDSVLREHVLKSLNEVSGKASTYRKVVGALSKGVRAKTARIDSGSESLEIIYFTKGNKVLKTLKPQVAVFDEQGVSAVLDLDELASYSKDFSVFEEGTQELISELDENHNLIAEKGVAVEDITSSYKSGLEESVRDSTLKLSAICTNEEQLNYLTGSLEAKNKRTLEQVLGNNLFETCKKTEEKIVNEFYAEKESSEDLTSEDVKLSLVERSIKNASEILGKIDRKVVYAGAILGMLGVGQLASSVNAQTEDNADIKYEYYSYGSGGGFFSIHNNIEINSGEKHIAIGPISLEGLGEPGDGKRLEDWGVDTKDEIGISDQIAAYGNNNKIIIWDVKDGIENVSRAGVLDKGGVEGQGVDFEGDLSQLDVEGDRMLILDSENNIYLFKAGDLDCPVSDSGFNEDYVTEAKKVFPVVDEHFEDNNFDYIDDVELSDDYSKVHFATETGQAWELNMETNETTHIEPDLNAYEVEVDDGKLWAIGAKDGDNGIWEVDLESGLKKQLVATSANVEWLCSSGSNLAWQTEDGVNAYITTKSIGYIHVAPGELQDISNTNIISTYNGNMYYTDVSRPKGAPVVEDPDNNSTINDTNNTPTDNPADNSNDSGDSNSIPFLSPLEAALGLAGAGKLAGKIRKRKKKKK